MTLEADRAWRELAERQPAANRNGKPIPKPWTNSRGTCPKMLGIALENRGDSFPAVPPGTLLALHTSTKWDEDAADQIRRWIPRVARVERDPATWATASRWRMAHAETGVWVDARRHMLPVPVPCSQGWFGVWDLPAEVRAAVVSELHRATCTPPWADDERPAWAAPCSECGKVLVQCVRCARWTCRFASHNPHPCEILEECGSVYPLDSAVTCARFKRHLGHHDNDRPGIPTGLRRVWGEDWPKPD